jgi:hypothetical protein
MPTGPETAAPVDTPRSEKEVVELAERFVDGRVDADTYFAAVTARAAALVDREASMISHSA